MATDVPSLPNGHQTVPSPLVEVTGAWRFRIPAQHRRLGIITPPHHLVHLMTEGTYLLGIEGVACTLREGDLIYYPPSATVDWLGNELPVSFMSVCFHAPGWTFAGRCQVFQDRGKLAGDFARVVGACQAAAQPAVSAQLQACRAVLTVMAELQKLSEPQPSAETSLSDLWWEIEGYVRQNQDWHMPVEAMADLVSRGRSTVHRACREATGTSPADRIRYLRLEQARDLLIHSPQSISSIAETLGYNRLQEFSREFASRLGRPPSTFRQEQD